MDKKQKTGEEHGSRSNQVTQQLPSLDSRRVPYQNSVSLKWDSTPVGGARPDLDSVEAQRQRYEALIPRKRSSTNLEQFSAFSGRSAQAVDPLITAAQEHYNNVMAVRRQKPTLEDSHFLRPSGSHGPKRAKGAPFVQPPTLLPRRLMGSGSR